MLLFTHFNQNALLQMGHEFIQRCFTPSETQATSPDQPDFLTVQSRLIAEQRQKLAGIVESFKSDHDGHLSDNLNFLVSHLTRNLDTMDALLNNHGGVSTSSEDNRYVVPVNADFFPKLALLILAVGISAAQLALIYPEVSGLVSLSIDGLFTMSEIAKSVFRPADNLQSTLQIFKDLQGLSLLLIGYLAANKALDFVDRGALGFGLGASALTIANLTLPGPIGKTLASSIGAALEQIRALLSDSLANQPQHANRPAAPV